MRAREQAGRVPLLTVVEQAYERKGRSFGRWLTLDDRGNQSPTTYESLSVALKHAAYLMAAWSLWLDEDNTFCR